MFSWLRSMRDFVDGGDVGAIDRRDFDGSHIKTIPVIEKHEFPKFNQYNRVNGVKKYKKTCTITNAVKDLCYNYGISFKKEYVYSAVDYCEKMGVYNTKHGRSTPKAMKWVRKRAKIELGINATFIRLWHTDTRLQEYKDKGYMIGCSFNGNTNYILDYSKDGVIDGTKYKPRAFGHRTSMYGNDRIRDSEYGFKYNDYKLKDLNGLIRDGTFNGWFYIWTLPETLVAPVEDLKRLIKFEIQVNDVIELNSEMWKKSNDEKFKDFLHKTNNRLREKIHDIKDEIIRHG